MAREPFDPLRAAFLIIFTVIIVYSVVVLGMVGACIWNADIIIRSGTDVSCDPYNRIMSLMTAALSAALALVGIRMSKDKDEDK